MPRMDGTGPMGRGPMTGAGGGPCNPIGGGNQQPLLSNRGLAGWVWYGICMLPLLRKLPLRDLSDIWFGKGRNKGQGRRS
jgi:hypothetical protein